MRWSSEHNGLLDSGRFRAALERSHRTGIHDRAGQVELAGRPQFGRQDLVPRRRTSALFQSRNLRQQVIPRLFQFRNLRQQVIPQPKPNSAGSRSHRMP